MYHFVLFAILAAPAIAADWTRSYHAGETLLSQGRATGALEQFRVALRRAETAGATRSQLLAIHDALGRAAFKAGQYRDAKKSFERSLGLAGEQPRSRAFVMSNFGQACQALGEFAHAEELYRQALEVMPDRAALWQLLGGVLVLERRYGDAEPALRRAIALADAQTAALARSDLAALFESRGKLREALALFEEAVSGVPAGQSRARILANLGLLHSKMGNHGDAATALSRSLQEMEIAVGPEHPEVARVLRDYGRVLGKTGHKAEARQAARRADAILSSFAGQSNAAGGTVDYRDLK